MIDQIYLRSAAPNGERYFFRLTALVLLAVAALALVFLNLSIPEVLTRDATVYPARVARLYAPQDVWVKLDRELAGARVQQDEQLGTLRYQLDDADVQEQLAQTRYQIALLKRQRAAPAASSDLALLDQQLALLQSQVTQLEQRAQPSALRAIAAGELRDVRADSSGFMFFHRGDLIAEIFSPDALVLRATVAPDQARQLGPQTTVFVSDQRTSAELPARIMRIYYGEPGDAGSRQLTVDLQVDQPAELQVGRTLRVRFVTGERRLYDMLRAVLVR